MINFNDYFYFAQVVDSKGITAASKALNLPKSKLSRRIAELEMRLGVRLIQRSSRTFLVTELGREFYRHARNMLVEAQAAECAVRTRLGPPSGTLRLACSPVAAALCLSTVLPGFLARFPQVRVEQRMLSRLDEMGARTADVYLVAHDRPLEDSSMVRRRLKAEPRHLFSSAGHAATFAGVTSPADLTGCPLFVFAEAPGRLLLTQAREEQDTILEDACIADSGLDLEPRLVSSDLGAVLSSVRAGMGVALLPASCGECAVQRGELVRVLPGWTGGTFEVSALLASSHGVLPAVRALIELIGECFAGRLMGPPALPSAQEQERHPQEEPA